MAWFRAFRGDFGYSHYGENRTSVTADIPFAAIIYTCILISIAAIIAAAGIRGRERWYTLSRITYSLAVGSILLVSIFGYCWQQGEISMRETPYIYRSKGHFTGVLGVHVGLHTVNLTLTGTYAPDNSNVKYNEELILGNVIKSPEQLWNALDRGLPDPLLTIIEHFDKDAGGLRYGRSSWMAGHFAYILLWTAFAFWVTGNILILSVIWYGAACFTLTGVCMVLSAVVYDYMCPQIDVKIHCTEEGILKLRYGWCFWTILIFGIITTVIGIILFTLDNKVPKKLAEFFLLDDPLEEDDYKQISINSVLTSRQLTPESTMRNFPNGRIKPGNTTNWYYNYGFDGQRSRSNPIFTEHMSDTSLTGNDIMESPRARAFSNITEEDQTTVKSDTSATVETMKSDTSTTAETVSIEHNNPDQTLDRLNDIYVDIESSRQVTAPMKEPGLPFVSSIHVVVGGDP